jgi:hypothetical protein
LYSYPDIIRQIKSRRMRWAGHVARMGKERKVNPEGKRDNLKEQGEDRSRMDIMETGWGM